MEWACASRASTLHRPTNGMGRCGHPNASPVSLYELVARGRICRLKIDRASRYRRADLLAYTEDLAREASEGGDASAASAHSGTLGPACDSRITDTVRRSTKPRSRGFVLPVVVFASDACCRRRSRNDTFADTYA
jgi:hypothetical protein